MGECNMVDLLTFPPKVETVILWHGTLVFNDSGEYIEVCQLLPVSIQFNDNGAGEQFIAESSNHQGQYGVGGTKDLAVFRLIATLQEE
jgi:hypothetical protein